jgi:hypothetical protein
VDGGLRDHNMDEDDLDHISLESLFPVCLKVETIIFIHILLQEPARPPSPKPTLTVYTRSVHKYDQKPQEDNMQAVCGNDFFDPLDTKTDTEGDDWTDIEIGLVGMHPLWGHHL